MTKRLRVLVEDAELAEIQAFAKRRRQSTSAFVREVLQAARQSGDYPTVESKLRALRQAVGHAYPTADLEQLNEEIERGYLSGPAATDA